METPENKKNTDDLICRYLNGDLNAEETRELINWIKLSRDNKKSFDEYSELWITARSASNNTGYNAQEGFWKFKQKIKGLEQAEEKPNRFRIVRNALRYAAIFIIAFLSGAFLYSIYQNKRSGLNEQTINELVVPLGSRANFTLADGTVVTLNAGSTIRADRHFGIKERTLELDGEAYFVVSEDKNKPFRVRTPFLTVTALGTEFNVKAYSVDDKIETTLVNGSVKIEPVAGKGSGEITILEPNQKLTFYKEEPAHTENRNTPSGSSDTGIRPARLKSDASAIKLLKENVDIEPVVSWKSNRWIVDNQSLSQMATDLERRFDVQIVFKSEKLKSYRFTGTILAEPIEQVLEVMSITSPISFSLNGRVVTLSENEDFIEVNRNLYTQPK